MVVTCPVPPHTLGRESVAEGFRNTSHLIYRGLHSRTPPRNRIVYVVPGGRRRFRTKNFSSRRRLVSCKPLRKQYESFPLCGKAGKAARQKCRVFVAFECFRRISETWFLESSCVKFRRRVGKVRGTHNTIRAAGSTVCVILTCV